MNGKTMRCPNLECRMGFVVKAMEATAPPAAFELPPEPPPPAKPSAPKPSASKPPKPKSAQPEVVDAVVVEAAVVSPPKVKEVVWSEGTDVPPPKKARKPIKPEVTDDSDDLPVRRKKQKNYRPLVLAGMGILIVFVLGFVVVYLLKMQADSEEKLAAQAKKHYEEGEYGEAVKKYETLVKDHPNSKQIAEYKFFHDLATMQTVVRSVTNRENYDAAIKRLREFIDTHKESPLAKPTSGYGRDVLEAGKKLGEDIAAHAEDRVKDYTKDRANKSSELSRADKAIADGRELVPLLDGFRGADDPPLKKLTDAFDAAEKSVKHERARTAAINKASEQLVDPTDAIIQGVVADLQTAGFLEDPEAQTLLAVAKGKLRDLVKYEDDPAGPQPPPPTAAASLLFVSPIGKTKFHESAPGDPPPTVFLCVARGILYALEDDTGNFLWATRVGPDVTDPPTVARVELASGLTDLAIVTSNVGNAPAVTAHVLKTGAARWYQPLPAPAAGPAVVMGTRAFVPVRDALGTVYEFDLTTGSRVGRIRLGQPVADRGATLRPGTSLLYVAADARRLYVIDVGGKDDNGNRVNPRCLQVIATNHLPGTLRVPPLFVGPEGTEPAERWMLLAQADGTMRTLLRAFKVEKIDPPAEGASVPETPAAPAVSLQVPGWIRFMPISDGERLAVVSDTGHFRLFGINQIGNLDKAMFPFVSPDSSKSLDRPVPGLVIPVEESTYWLLTSGQMQKARLAMVPKDGQKVVLADSPQPIGEPVHAAQVNGRKDTACVVVRSLNSSGCRAVAFSLRDGEIRWQRQLGLVPAKMSSTEQFAAPVAQGDRFILVDEDGGIVAIPAASEIGVGQTVAAQATWVIAPPPLNSTGPTVVVSSADGKVVYTITPVTQDGPKFVIRRVADGKLSHEDFVNAPAALAGQPAIIGDHLLIPDALGFVHRLVPGDGRVRPGALVPGPSWLGERRPGVVPTCSITPISDTAFTTSDGGKKLSRWDWPAGGKWSASGSWELSQNVAGPGIVLPPAEAGGSPRMIVADTGGSVWMFAADRAGQAHLKRWRPGGVIPAGKPSSNFALQATDATSLVVTLVVDGKAAAAISPDRDEALWAARTGEEASNVIVGAPQPAGANRWVITDLAGRVLLLDGTKGEVIATQTVGLPGAVPAASSGVAANIALTPLSDGSAVVIELPKAEMPPKKE